MDDYNKIIGSNVRFERQKRDLTIEELSEILCIAPGFLGLIERGQRGTSLKNLCKIADFFSISLDQLITCPAGTVVKSEAELMSEKTEAQKLEEKYATAISLIHGLNEYEIDFFISNVKNVRKLIKRNEIKNKKAAKATKTDGPIPDDVDYNLDDFDDEFYNDLDNDLDNDIDDDLDL